MTKLPKLMDLKLLCPERRKGAQMPDRPGDNVNDTKKPLMRSKRQLKRERYTGNNAPRTGIVNVKKKNDCAFLRKAAVFFVPEYYRNQNKTQKTS